MAGGFVTLRHEMLSSPKRLVALFTTPVADKGIVAAEIERAVAYASGDEGAACTTEAACEVEETHRSRRTSGGSEGEVTYVR